MRRVAIIGSAGIPARYGGFETLAQNLVHNLYMKFDFIVYCTRRLYNNKERKANCKYADLIYLRISANGPLSIIYDFISIIHGLRKADVLLILGTSGCFILPAVRLITGKRIITNIDGLEWMRSKWGFIARMVLKLSEYIAVKYSDYIIADNNTIRDYLSNKYKISPVFIEYGGDPADILNDSNRNDTVDDKDVYALTVSRVEPENNIHIILDAFSKMPARKITLVGNWTNNRYGRRLYRSYNHYPNIALYNSIYNQNGERACLGP